MGLVNHDQIFEVEEGTVRYLQLRRASIEADSFVHTPSGFRQSNSAGGLRSVSSFDEACELGQKAAVMLKELTDC